MQLTLEQKERFMKYLEERGKEVPSKLVNKIEDVFGLCIDDIIEQMQNHADKFDINKIEDLKDNLAKKMFNQAVTMSVISNDEIDPNFLKELNESQSFEEVTLKLHIYTEKYPDFAFQLYLQFLTTYFQICIEYKMQPNEIIVILNEFLLQL